MLPSSYCILRMKALSDSQECCDLIVRTGALNTLDPSLFLGSLVGSGFLKKGTHMTCRNFTGPCIRASNQSCRQPCAELDRPVVL
eukprot:8744793-Pyramimonas_sp.AAC.1